MSYARPTVSEFKSQFPRDFPYSVPAWGARGTITLLNGVITAIAVASGGFGYGTAPSVTVEDSSGSGATITVTVGQGKVTAFAVGAGGTGYQSPRLIISGGAGSDSDFSKVLDADVEGAFEDAGFNVNEELFGSQSDYNRAFNYLAAHNLVTKLLAAGQGLASQGHWLTASKSVGEVSESFEIPDRIKKDPFLAALSKTGYGMAYLQIITPLLIGNVMTSFRQSLP